MKNNSISILEELKSLKEIYKNRIKHINDYASNAHIEAFNMVVNNKYNLGNFNDLEVDVRNDLSIKYSSEINKFKRSIVEVSDEYNELLKEADELISRIEKIELEFLNIDKKREYRINSIIEGK